MQIYLKLSIENTRNSLFNYNKLIAFIDVFFLSIYSFIFSKLRGNGFKFITKYTILLKFYQYQTWNALIRTSIIHQVINYFYHLIEIAMIYSKFLIMSALFVLVSLFNENFECISRKTNFYCYILYFLNLSNKLND